MCAKRNTTSKVWGDNKRNFENFDRLFLITKDEIFVFIYVKCFEVIFMCVYVFCVCGVCKKCNLCLCRWEFWRLNYDRMVLSAKIFFFDREQFCLLNFYVCVWNFVVFVFCSFNKPIILANLFAAISSFFDRFRMSEQSRSSLPSKHSTIPLQTSDISMHDSESDLQLNWSGLHRVTGKLLIGYGTACLY